jgi:hypothetical protein
MVYTGFFRGRLEAVGKQGQVRGEAGRLSKSPELHSPDLENLAIR